jgi:hypothetical protein
MSPALLIDVIGWFGAVAILVAYTMVSTRGVKGDSVTYQMLNLWGSIGLVTNTLYYGAYPSTLVNVVWAGIAVYTLLIVRRRLAKVADGEAN